MSNDQEDLYCGAKKHRGGTCGNRKGFRTEHPGIGRCYPHGGASPNHQIAAERQMVAERMRTYGAPIDTDPKTALFEECSGLPALWPGSE